MNRHTNSLFKVLFVAACCAVPSPALADWPFVRGDASASGVAQTTLPDDLELVWKQSIGESGFEATALIVEGKIFVGDFDSTFYAFQLDDGEPLWKQKLAEVGFTQAAAYADGKIVASDLDAFVYCLDARTGEQLWKYEAASESYAAPNIVDGKVLLTLEAGELVALDLNSGEQLWKFQIDAPLRCWPTVVNGKAMLAGCDQQFHTVNVDTGKEDAVQDIDAQTGSTPAVMNGTVYFGTEQGSLYAIDAKTMEVQWQYRDAKRGQAIRSAAVVDPRAVIFPNQGKTVTALNPADGKPLWTFTVRSRVESSPVLVGDRVYLATKRGRLYAVDIAKGEERWQYQAGGAFTASPAVAEERLVIGNEDGTLYCFGKKE